ncbi:putative bifunctional diguanylate cyclase/phosphodiesterase, partial [Devosia sp.]|uniref:putative bifunctional diguanylate cyclase/phosphodiesterase n=1 Tax=Devosia sp. TaxID=1871048 RepID=UPI0035B38F01
GRDQLREPEAWIENRLRQHRRPGRTSTQHLSDGRWLQVRERLSPSGNIVGVRTDITALKRAEQQIKNQSERDPLTGLYNRSVLIDQLSRQVDRSLRSGTPGALAVFDLDGFKDINDSLGHAAGDTLLGTIGRRLRAALRASDIEVRLGGDEFALILPRLADTRLVERLLARVYEAIEAPLRLGGRRIRPAASMGVCLFPRDGTDPAELLRNADIALYQAKARGRGRHCFFSTPLRERIERREALADDLRIALERDEIGIALQPQIATAGGLHVGFEALARWLRRGADVPPGQFIPVAEQTELIVPLGQRVLERALSELARMRLAGLRPGPVAVNVAAAQLKLPDFVESVMDCLARTGSSPADLEVEVTETVLLDRSAEQIGRSLAALHERGVSIALDDFGTGHASLSHLKRFPVDRLKIDRSFVAGIGDNAEDEIIVKAVINLAQSLGKSVVAEGVETDEQLQFLAALGCDTVQGYLLGRPLPPHEAALFVAQRTRPRAA